jgi:hypothetical protein
MKSMVVVWTYDDDQALDLKRRKRKIKRAQGKGDIHRAIMFSVIKT